MANWGTCDFKELEKLRDKLEAAAKQEEIDAFCEACAKELAARLLRKVIKRTPTDTGNLRKNWTTQANGSGSEGLKSRGATQYVDTLKVHHYGNVFVIEVSNPTAYAPYVEYGHRQEPGRYVPAIGKRLKKGWVEGKFMLTISEKEIAAAAPRILEKKLAAHLKEVFQ